jgi:hypothetical protein
LAAAGNLRNLKNLNSKKNEDRETFRQFRNKHNDKALYRMLKKEEKDVS